MWLSFCVFLNTRYKPYNVKEVDPIMCHLCRRPIAISFQLKPSRENFQLGSIEILTFISYFGDVKIIN